MQGKIYNIPYDIKQGVKTYEVFNFTSEDNGSCQFDFTISDKEVAYNLTDTIVRLVAKSPNGATIQQDCSITSATSGKAHILLLQSFFSVAGKWTAELQIYNSVDQTLRLSLPQFTYRVGKSLMDDGTVEASDEFSLLQNMIINVSDASALATQALDTANTALVTADDAVTTITAQIANVNTAVTEVDDIVAEWGPLAATIDGKSTNEFVTEMPLVVNRNKNTFYWHLNADGEIDYVEDWIGNRRTLTSKSLIQELATMNTVKADKEEYDLYIYKTGNIPPGSVAFTFDDGNRNNLDIVHPLLKAKGFPATEFVVSNDVRLTTSDTFNLGYLSIEQLLQMQTEGWEIGSHTKTHTNLATLTDEGVRLELAESKNYLESIGLSINSLAFPFGGVPTNQNIPYEYYENVAQTFGAINVFPKTKFVYRFFPENSSATTVAKVLELIEYARQRNGYVVLGFHRIADDISANAWRVDKFTELLDSIDPNKVFAFKDIARAKDVTGARLLNKYHYDWGSSDGEPATSVMVKPIALEFQWDYLKRALCIDLKSNKKLFAIRVKDRYSNTPRLNNSNIEIWKSNDNITFTRHTEGFEYYHYIDAKLEDTKVSIFIKIKHPSQHRYWKIHQTINQTNNLTRVYSINTFMDAWITN